jgi:hypothetical protein
MLRGPDTPRTPSKPINVGGGSFGAAAQQPGSQGHVGHSLSPLAYAGVGSDGVEDLLEGSGACARQIRTLCHVVGGLA